MRGALWTQGHPDCLGETQEGSLEAVAIVVSWKRRQVCSHFHAHSRSLTKKLKSGEAGELHLRWSMWQ